MKNEQQQPGKEDRKKEYENISHKHEPMPAYDLNDMLVFVDLGEHALGVCVHNKKSGDACKQGSRSDEVDEIHAHQKKFSVAVMLPMVAQHDHMDKPYDENDQKEPSKEKWRDGNMEVKL
jgi:hypothetical protein